MPMFRPTISLLFAATLALAGCGQSDVSIGEGAEEGSGSLAAQLRATCVSQVENNATLSAAASQICDCATERAREDLSVADLMAGEANGLQDSVAQCADQALGLGGATPTSSRTET
ncbi:hypothetical protein E3U23_04480 [Erythrobacter litoralis]|uniref:hypothetical protein n=1 Tax=Erythrobacter litoralis TaxID=39960 RepID=UPI0024354D85|nr:hypothetical protein [Erythrobacter litoralis]MDG6078447.1 hypothetical protein [Erythrobacter litoralis]